MHVFFYWNSILQSNVSECDILSYEKPRSTLMRYTHIDWKSRIAFFDIEPLDLVALDSNIGQRRLDFLWKILNGFLDRSGEYRYKSLKIILSYRKRRRVVW
jgi:hypothetical protein